MRRPALWNAGALWSALVLGCSPPPGGEVTELSFPPSTTFGQVGEALHANCGTLDCHGQVGRNLRLYGQNGLRLDPAHISGGVDHSQVPGGEFAGGSTTEAEIAENYRSVLALEPELLNTVMREGGVAPERLTLVRKGRGTDHHKGGVAMRPGEAMDQCLLSWLASEAVLAGGPCASVTERHAPDAGVVP